MSAYVGRARVAHDVCSVITLAGVQAPAQVARFTTGLPASNSLALGFTCSAYWLRLTLRNSSTTPVERMLVVDNPRISHIQAYLPNAHDNYQSISTRSNSAAPTSSWLLLLC